MTDPPTWYSTIMHEQNLPAQLLDAIQPGMSADVIRYSPMALYRAFPGASSDSCSYGSREAANDRFHETLIITGKRLSGATVGELILGARVLENLLNVDGEIRCLKCHTVCESCDARTRAEEFTVLGKFSGTETHLLIGHQIKSKDTSGLVRWMLSGNTLTKVEKHPTRIPKKSFGVVSVLNIGDLSLERMLEGMSVARVSAGAADIAIIPIAVVSRVEATMTIERGALFPVFEGFRCLQCATEYRGHKADLLSYEGFGRRQLEELAFETLLPLCEKGERKHSVEHSRLCRRLREAVELGLGSLTFAKGLATLTASESQRLKLLNLVIREPAEFQIVVADPGLFQDPTNLARVYRAGERLRRLGNQVIFLDSQANECVDTSAQLVSANDTFYAPARWRTKPGKQKNNSESVEAHVAVGPDRERRRFAFRMGEVTAIVGGNNSGKSNFLRAVQKELSRALFIDTEEGDHAGDTLAAALQLFEPLGKFLGALPIARREGITQKMFSLESPSGRCPRCAGKGVLRIDFGIAGALVEDCSECLGQRFRSEVLAVRYREKHIGEILAMTVREAVPLFAHVAPVLSQLELGEQIGCGGVTLSCQVSSLPLAVQKLLFTFVGLTARSYRAFLIDQPLTGLAPQQASVMKDAILDRAQNGAIILLTSREHIDWADRVISFPHPSSG